MYVKYFGQEIAFAHIDKEMIEQALEVWHTQQLLKTT